MVPSAPQEMASPSDLAQPVSPEPLEIPQQMEPTQQPTQSEPVVWTNNTSDTQTSQTTEMDESSWSTEQVWEWGRTQGWSDEQIAAYETVYDESVRNPPKQFNEEFEVVETTQELDGKTEEIVNQEPTPTNETVVEEVVEPAPQESQTAKQDVRDKGIMKAMSGTTQGEAGWYLDGEGNPSRWDIDDDGIWHRTG
jgi:hypothetical protein